MSAMMGQKILAILIALAAAIAAAWATDRFAIRAPYDALAIQLFGSLFIATLTWAMVSVPRRKQLFLALKRNHITLLRFWKIGPKDSIDQNDIQKQRLLCAFYDAIDSQKDLFVELRTLGGIEPRINDYDSALGNLLSARKHVEEEAEGYKIWSPTYCKPWNDCHVAYKALARKISWSGSWRISRDDNLFTLGAAEPGKNSQLPSGTFWKLRSGAEGVRDSV